MDGGIDRHRNRLPGEDRNGDLTAMTIGADSGMMWNSSGCKGEIQWTNITT
jgi:hypothetical protein